MLRGIAGLAVSIGRTARVAQVEESLTKGVALGVAVAKVLRIRPLTRTQRRTKNPGYQMKSSTAAKMRTAVSNVGNRDI